MRKETEKRGREQNEKKGETVRERRDIDTVRVEGRVVRQCEKRGRQSESREKRGRKETMRGYGG